MAAFQHPVVNFDNKQVGTVDLLPVELDNGIIIVAAAAIVQYFQGKLSLPKNNKPTKDLSSAEKIGRQMVFLGPALTLVILYNLPSAIGLYWLTTSLFSVIQQIVINKQLATNN